MQISEGYLEYDSEADVLYVHLGSSDVAETRALGDYRNVDVSDQGAVLGIEFIDASHGIDLHGVPFGDVAEALIRNEGLGFPIYA